MRADYPQAVLFDMDGLLLDTERVYLSAFVETQKDFGLAQQPDLFLACVGVRADRTDLILAAHYGADFDIARFRADWDLRMAQGLSGEIPRRPGVEDLLTLLRDRGIAMGVATSTRAQVARQHLEHSHLGGFFEHLVGGDDVANPKPDPEIYLRLAERMGRPIARCVAFEDSNPGIAAAVASGARAVQVPDLTVPTPQVRALGHVIADDILAGAVQVGLIERADLR